MEYKPTGRWIYTDLNPGGSLEDANLLYPGETADGIMWESEAAYDVTTYDSYDELIESEGGGSGKGILMIKTPPIVDRWMLFEAKKLRASMPRYHLRDNACAGYVANILKGGANIDIQRDAVENEYFEYAGYNRIQYFHTPNSVWRAIIAAGYDEASDDKPEGIVLGKYLTIVLKEPDGDVNTTTEQFVLEYISPMSRYQTFQEGEEVEETEEGTEEENKKESYWKK